ncbi:MAG: UbiD family decarboxylase [Actinobacteria bacterium]|nr:UbiD family decarboxylase [Actinomycetota bacterium]
MGGADLRQWLKRVEELGELKPVQGADCDLEIGTIVDIAIEKVGRPAFLFDNIPDFRPGRRVLGNVLMSPTRVALASGLDPKLGKFEIVKTWQRIFRELPQIAFREVSDGPIFQNVQRGDQLALKSFPAPRWHEKDGGYFVGTGCLVVMKDPESDWVNAGAYRIQVHDDRTAGIMITRGRHGDVIMRKYWDRGEACPVAVVLGGHPLFLMLAGVPVPDGISEYDLAGGILGEPVEVVLSPELGIPVPAGSELVMEGLIPPDVTQPEGPFGEWTGYYAAPLRDQPVIQIKSICFRDDPINLGVMPGKPPNDNTYYLNYLQSALLWSQLEKAGVPGIRGVWGHEAGGSRMWVTVSLKQLFPGHAKQAGLVAASCRAGGYVNRVTVVVDDDIDPTNTDEVIWAICTRMDPKEDVEVLRRMQASPLDPMAYPSDVRAFNSRMVIDACIPWERRGSFPPVARATPELRNRIWDEWHHLFE